jgi:pimeloyl-[acyl-carrier protein] methyl ester esterase
VHGWSRSGADLAGLASRLEDRFRVVRPDLRGHGRSTPGPASLELLAADLAAVAEAEPAGAVLLGWSLGGLVALAALPRLRARLRGLVLLGATPRFTVGDAWPHGQPARAVEGLALRVRRQPARACVRFLEDCFAPGELDEAGRGRLAPLFAAPPPDPAAALAGLEILASADLRAALAAVDLPLLVIHGEADPIVPAGAGRALAAAVPGAELAVLPGAGHAPFLSREAEVAGLVARFAGRP